MKNSIKLIASAALMFIIHAGLYADPSVEVSVDKSTGNPGDTITFSIKVKDTAGVNVTKIRTPTLNGGAFYSKKVADGDIWIAEPGLYLLKCQMFWSDDAGATKTTSGKTIVEISGWEKPGDYLHPGLSVTANGLERIQKNIKIPGHPMQIAWDSFKNQNTNYIPKPIEDGKTAKRWVDDGKKAGRLALAWAVSGDKKYADGAIRIYNFWAQDIKKYPGWLIKGPHYSNNWMNGVELLKYYKGHGGSGWKAADIKAFDDYVRYKIYPMIISGHAHYGSPFSTQNQPLGVAKFRMQVGIYLNDEVIFKMGYHLLFNIYKTHYGNTKFEPIFDTTHVNLFQLGMGPGGEYMEANRDGTHMGMCVGYYATMAEFLWNQKGYVDGNYDMYGMILLGEKTPRYFQSLEWLTNASLNGGAPLSKNGGVMVLGQLCLGRVWQWYNHYYHRLNDKYPLPAKLVEYAMKYESKKSDNRLLYADLDKDETVIVKENMPKTVNRLQLSCKIINKKIAINYHGTEKAQVKLFDLSGRLLSKLNFSKAGSKNISLKGFRKGMYIINIKSVAGSKVQKVLYQ